MGSKNVVLFLLARSVLELIVHIIEKSDGEWANTTIDMGNEALISQHNGNVFQSYVCVFVYCNLYVRTLSVYQCVDGWMAIWFDTRFRSSSVCYWCTSVDESYLRMERLLWLFVSVVYWIWQSTHAIIRDWQKMYLSYSYTQLE